VVAIFCGKLVEGERPAIFGDCTQTRDYVFVGDVVEANLSAAQSRATGPFNIGREVQHIALDASKAKDEFRWEARVSLEEGLERTLDSLR
jgi:UDP-glucose 4-epimerase